MKRNIPILPLIAVAFILLGLLLFVTRKNSILTPNKGNGQHTQNNSSLPQAQKTRPPEEEQLEQNQTLVTIDDSSRNTVLPGKSEDNSDLLNKYGKYAFETFQKYPDLVEKIKLLDNSFNSSQMDPSFPSHVYQLDNGKEYLALGGCTAHNCAGTKIIIIYNEKDDAIFMAKENDFETQLRIIGDPSEQERDLLIYFYFLK